MTAAGMTCGGLFYCYILPIFYIHIMNLTLILLKTAVFNNIRPFFLNLLLNLKVFNK